MTGTPMPPARMRRRRGASNLAELSQRLERHLMIRRLKEQVGGPGRCGTLLPVEAGLGVLTLGLHPKCRLLRVPGGLAI